MYSIRPINAFIRRCLILNIDTELHPVESYSLYQQVKAEMIAKLVFRARYRGMLL